MGDEGSQPLERFTFSEIGEVECSRSSAAYNEEDRCHRVRVSVNHGYLLPKHFVVLSMQAERVQPAREHRSEVGSRVGCSSVGRGSKEMPESVKIYMGGSVVGLGIHGNHSQTDIVGDAG